MPGANDIIRFIKAKIKIARKNYKFKKMTNSKETISK